MGVGLPRASSCSARGEVAYTAPERGKSACLGSWLPRTTTLSGCGCAASHASKRACSGVIAS